MSTNCLANSAIENSRTAVISVTPASLFTKAIFLGWLLLLAPALIMAQTDPETVELILKQEIIAPQAAGFELRRLIVDHVTPPPLLPGSAKAWDAEQVRLRQHLLNDVVFHGWPSDWANGQARFEDLGALASGQGYKVRKLRYEIVPGFQSVAILYEPEKLQARNPAILNVNGHEEIAGKSAEYKQKRCINFARHGIIALNLEWLGCGELRVPGNEHWFGGHLDLTGANELGLFFLEMRKGLDYLYGRPDVDRDRLGMTGLSGGGWQTIILSSLDERITVSVPVAGFSSLRTRVEVRKYGDLGDVEQSATDLLAGQEYTHLLAMRAPRPTLLIYNDEDNCCFRAPLVKPRTYDAIKPFFALYGKPENLQWHENADPANHNYQSDNRQAAYQFFSEKFGLPAFENEAGVAGEIKDYDELAVGLPEHNLTLLDLARKLGHEIRREPIPGEGTARDSWARSERQKLQEVVRSKPVRIASTWPVASTKSKGLETKAYLFNMDNGLTANAVWLKAIDAPQNAPVTLVLADGGKWVSSRQVSDRVNRGEQVLAVDLLFTGDAWTVPEPYLYAEILHGLGERPLGMEAAQLIAIAQAATAWAAPDSGLRLEVSGIRNQVVALVAAALQPQLFSSIRVHEGMRTLGFLLDAPVPYSKAPELFCLDLYKYFDLDQLAAMAGSTSVTLVRQVEPDEYKETTAPR